MKRVIAGIHAVEEALRSRASQVAVVYLALDKAERRALQQIAEQAQKAKVRCELSTSDHLDQLTEGVQHQGAVAIAGQYAFHPPEELLPAGKSYPLLIALDQMTDPHNFGAVVRSAVAFGVDGIITLKDRAAPVTAAVVRASAGATEYARIARVTNLARTLADFRRRGLQVIGLDGAAPERLSALPFPPQGRLLVIGSEGRGLRRLVRDNCDALAGIALDGPIASLNASVAAAIAIYESMRQRALVA
jgi:23S rRNA (guanosine2251-2'-O)-methyltransferase